MALSSRRPLTRLVAVTEVRKRAARVSDSVLDAMDASQRTWIVAEENRTSL